MSRRDQIRPDYGPGDLVVCVEYSPPENPDIDADPVEVGKTYICEDVWEESGWCPTGMGFVFSSYWLVVIRGKRVSHVGGLRAGYPPYFFQKAPPNRHIDLLRKVSTSKEIREPELV